VAVRLLAGGAHIHVDFHANRHFNDLWCFPSHLALLLVKLDEISSEAKVSWMEKFAYLNLFNKTAATRRPSAKQAHAIVQWR
jgi:hypothetical protein